MSDLDRLRPAFEELRGAVLPAVRPPGVAAARRTLRRRRRNRALVAAVVAGLAAAGLTGVLLRPPVPAPTADPSPSVTPSVTGSAAPVPTAAGSPGVPPPRATTLPSPGASATAGGGGRPPPAAPPTPVSTCKPEGNVDLVSDINGLWTVSARVDGRYDGQLCPDERIRVFWATYTVDGDGVLHLYRSAEHVVDDNNWEWKFRMDLPRQCSVAYYIVSGNAPVLTTISAADASGSGRRPYPDHRIADYVYPACPG
jgi:hypothetical protein